MEKIKKFFSIILVILISMAFVSDNQKPKGEKLFSGEIRLGEGFFSIGGEINFYLEVDSLKIKSISVLGNLSFLTEKGSLKISELKKDTLNHLSISEEIDKLIYMNLDNFSEDGGIVIVDINTEKITARETVYISKHKDTIFSAYRDSISPGRKIEKLDIQLVGKIYRPSKIKIKKYTITVKDSLR